MPLPKCDFVSGAKASWHCQHCNVNYSEKCIPDGFNPMWGRDGPVCVLCHSPLDDVNDPSLHLPFWQVLPYLLIYPFHYNALIVMALAVGGIVLVADELLGLIYAFLFTIVSFKYLLSIITKRAEGERWSPSLLTLARPDPHWLFVQMLGIYVVFVGGIIGNAKLWGMWGAIGYCIFVALLLPASIMILATEKNLLQAVNPLRLIGLAINIGLAPYIVLWIFTVAIGLAMTYAEQWLNIRLEQQWQLPAYFGVCLYFSIVLHALFGYVLFQYRNEVGLSIESDTPMLEGDEFRKAKLLGSIEVLQKRQDQERVRQCMRELLDVCRDDLEVHKKYQSLLLTMNDTEALERHTDYYAQLLLNAKKPGDALAVVKETAEVDTKYRVRNPDTALALATLLDKKKEHRLLVQIVANLHQRVQPCAQVPAVYLLVVKALVGPLAKPDKAKAVATYVLKTYPKAPENKTLAKLIKTAR